MSSEEVKLLAKSLTVKSRVEVSRTLSEVKKVLTVKVQSKCLTVIVVFKVLPVKVVLTVIVEWKCLTVIVCVEVLTVKVELKFLTVIVCVDNLKIKLY